MSATATPQPSDPVPTTFAPQEDELPQPEQTAASRLLAYLEGDPDGAAVTLMASVADQLVQAPGSSPTGDPLFVNEGTGPNRTVGILLIMPRPSPNLDEERIALARVGGKSSAGSKTADKTNHSDTCSSSRGDNASTEQHARPPLAAAA